MDNGHSFDNVITQLHYVNTHGKVTNYAETLSLTETCDIALAVGERPSQILQTNHLCVSDVSFADGH